jgi:hypothetical protein
MELICLDSMICFRALLALLGRKQNTKYMWWYMKSVWNQERSCRKAVNHVKNCVVLCLSTVSDKGSRDYFQNIKSWSKSSLSNIRKFAQSLSLII